MPQKFKISERIKIKKEVKENGKEKSYKEIYKEEEEIIII
jgi:hypothetical protein